MTTMYTVWFYDHGEKVLYGTFLQEMAESIAVRLVTEKKVKVHIEPVCGGDSSEND